MPLTPSERLKAVIILDGQGNRISAKYYSGYCSTLQEQSAYEKNLPTKEETGDGAWRSIVDIKLSFALENS